MKKATTLLAALALVFALTGCGNGTSAPASTASTPTSAASTPESAASTPESMASTPESAASTPASAASTPESAASTLTSAAGDLWANAAYTADSEIGQGAHSVQIEVKAGGKSVTLTVKSDNDNLEKILVENKLVEGDESEFGLYIKKVIGIRADYDADGAYWALCKNGEMTSTGAGGITIADGEHYEFIYTAADAVQPAA